MKIIKLLIYVIVISLALQLALHFGVERKSWWQLSWEFITGGSVGALAGVVFFLTFGAIGWVSGAAYGAIGLFGLVAGGTLGGLGLGALVHIARHPGHYVYNVPLVVLVLAVGLVFAHIASRLITHGVLHRRKSLTQSHDSHE